MDDIVLEIVAKAYGYTVLDLLSKGKKGKTPEARRMAVLFLNTPKAKPQKIADAINRERTAFYACTKKIAFEIVHYQDVQEKFKTIQMSLLTYLENTQTELENWLINNPHQDQQVREEKLKRLAAVKETHEYIINLKP